MADVLTDEQSVLLATFLRTASGRMFEWGLNDCGLFLADWIMVAKSVPDPAAAVRGTYEDAVGASVAVNGDLVAFIDSFCGCPQTEAPKDGDIGVINLAVGGETCGIMTRGSWAFRTTTGLAWAKIIPGRLLKAWSVF